MSTVQTLEALPAISLAELVSDAELQIRTDRKYVLDLQGLAALLDSVSAGTRVLEIDGRRAFGYASTYFDTPDLLSHGGAAHRRRRRFKVRTRHYLDSGDCFLEVKTRGRRGATVKDRIVHADPLRLGMLGRAHVRAALEHAHVTGVDIAGLTPVLHTSYQRSTLLMADGGRATIDLELRWRLPGADARSAGPIAVVETKTAPGSGRSDLDRALTAAGYRPARLSKYGTGLALSLPTVSHNRWNRVLSGPLRRAS